MGSKRLWIGATTVCAALAAAGVAVAGHGGAARSQAAAATFSATTVSTSRQTTCTAKGGDTFQTTLATYKGTGTSSDARLAGTLVIKAKSVVDETTGLGSVAGAFRIKGSGGSATHGRLRAAISNGQIAGLISGEAKKPAGRLLASLAATFDPSSGFATGSFGTGLTTGAGAIFSGGRCG